MIYYFYAYNSHFLCANIYVTRRMTGSYVLRTSATNSGVPDPLLAWMRQVSDSSKNNGGFQINRRKSDKYTFDIMQRKQFNFRTT